jgi:hypothetical protein
LHTIPQTSKRRENSQYQAATYDGVGFEGKIYGVSILRAGEVRTISLLSSI